MAKKEKDIKDMSLDELIDSLNSLKKEVFNIGIQKMAGQFEDTSQISKKKKNLPILFSFNKMVKKITGKKKSKKIIVVNFARK